LNRATDHVYGL